MVNNDWLHIKTLLNFIQHGTFIGPGSRVGGLKVVRLLASAELCEEMPTVDYFCHVRGSMIDQYLAQFIKLIIQTHELPEHHLHKFWENVKSSIFTKI